MPLKVKSDKPVVSNQVAWEAWSGDTPPKGLGQIITAGGGTVIFGESTVSYPVWSNNQEENNKQAEKIINEAAQINSAKINWNVNPLWLNAAEPAPATKPQSMAELYAPKEKK